MEYKNIGALWRKKTFLQGVVNVNGKEVPIWIFPNPRKSNFKSNKPDWVIYTKGTKDGKV